MDASKEHSILERLSIGDGAPGVYWIGRRATRLTFLSQQQRALNLIWALHSTQKLAPGDDVTVVGAGLAGLTAAFAASQLGAKVRLIESKLVPLHLQRGCQLRFVHPHVLDWPDRMSEIPLTDLPCLNWGADIAARICNTVLEQWAEIRQGIEENYGWEVRQIGRGRDDRPLVFAEGRNGNWTHACDHLILAIGFGLERSLPSVPFLSYWENDNFGRPVISGPIPRRYLVTGCGDGGLIDAIRLRINAFDHAEFVYMVSRVAKLGRIKKRLLRIDAEVAAELRKATPVDSDLGGRLLDEKYRSLDIPADLKRLLTDQLREDTTVFLNSPALSPLSLKASILNRFIVFLLREYGGLRYRAGEVELVSAVAGQPFRVRFHHKSFPPEELDVHELVVRHGPIPVIDRLFPETVACSCRPGANDFDDPTRQQQYPPRFLASPHLRARKRKVVLQYAIATSALAAKERFNPAEHDRFGIEVTGDFEQVRYILRPRRSGDPTQVFVTAPFYGIPILVDSPVGPPLSERKPAGASDDASLTLGMAILNIGQSRRFPSARSGTLGCFVRLRSTGERAILTSINALGGPGKVRPGDRIVRAGMSVPHKQAVVAFVGNLHSPTPSSPRSSLAAGNVFFNRFDAAVAVLRPHVQIETRLDVYYPNLPPLRSGGDGELTGLIGAEVFKVGSSSGLTRGRIESVEATIDIQSGEEQYWYEGMFLVSSLNGGRFSQPGDGGAVVARHDGVVLGLVIAGNVFQTVVCPIQPILEAYDCELL